MRRSLVPVIGLLLVASAIAGCAPADKQPPAPATSKAMSFAQLAPEPVKRCDYPTGTRKVVVTTPDGVTLAGAEAGTGSRGLVLLHQRSADLCGWSGYVPALVKAGLHVLAIDLRCNGLSDCDRESPGDPFDQTFDYATDTAAAVAFLRSAGATKVGVMGASMGAAVAVVTGGRFADQVDAVVALSLFSISWNGSGQSAATDVRTPADAVPRTRAPILIAVGGQDSSTIAAGQARALLADAPAGSRCTVVDRPDSPAHGWSMLDLGADSVQADVLAFLATNVPG